MKAAIVYKITNTINNKIYIGKTVKTLPERKGLHKFLYLHKEHEGGHYPLYRAMRKYGWNNFKWEIIDKCLFNESAIELEKYYIKKFNCMVPRGYNCTAGGDGLCGHHHSEETKKKISISNTGKKLGKQSAEHREKRRISYINGHHHLKASEETKLKMRLAHKNHPRHHSEETRKKISESLQAKLKSGWRSTPIGYKYKPKCNGIKEE
jgi:group I intron endonuclease